MSKSLLYSSLLTTKKNQVNFQASCRRLSSRLRDRPKTNAHLLSRPILPSPPSFMKPKNRRPSALPSHSSLGRAPSLFPPLKYRPPSASLPPFSPISLRIARLAPPDRDWAPPSREGQMSVVAGLCFGHHRHPVAVDCSNVFAAVCAPTSTLTSCHIWNLVLITQGVAENHLIWLL